MTAPGRKGPIPVSCDACRLRRTRCSRLPRQPSHDSQGAPPTCEGCAKRGINCITSQLPLSQRQRTGPRIEAAKALCGTTSLSSASPQQQLVASTLASDIGYELLHAFTEAGGASGMPVFPAPLLDYVALLSRFEAAGRQVSSLAVDDQLVFRVICAAAAPHWAARASTHSAMPLQLLQDAQSNADALAIWRKPTLANAVALILLQQAAGRGNIASDNACAYLSSAAGHIHALKERDPVALVSNGIGTTAFTWTATVVDACAAVERTARPYISDADFDELFRSEHGYLESRAKLQEALDHPWPLTVALSRPLLVSITLLRDVATLLDQTRSVDQAQDRLVEYEEALRTQERLLEWGTMALDVARSVSEPLQHSILTMYTNTICAPVLFAELAIVKHLGRLVDDDGRRHFPAPPEAIAGLGLEQRHVRLRTNACAYLRATRDASAANYVVVMTGTFWSTRLLCEMAQLVLATSAWDDELHPGGPRDKLASLNYLHAALESQYAAYPETPRLAETLQAVAHDKLTLDVLLGSELDALYAPTSHAQSASPPSTVPSLTRINSWTYLTDTSTIESVRRAIALGEPTRPGSGSEPPARTDSHAPASPGSYFKQETCASGVEPSALSSPPPTASLAPFPSVDPSLLDLLALPAGPPSLEGVMGQSVAEDVWLGDWTAVSAGGADVLEGASAGVSGWPLA